MYDAFPALAKVFLEDAHELRQIMLVILGDGKVDSDAAECNYTEAEIKLINHVQGNILLDLALYEQKEA